MSGTKHGNVVSHQNRSCPRLRGSFSVEATLVVSLLVLVLFMTLRMTFFLTDSVRMEAVLSEDSLCEMQENSAGTGKAQASGGFFLLSPSHIQTRKSTEQVTVSLRQDPVRIWPGGQSYFEVQYARDLRKPVTYLRRSHFLTTLISNG